MNPTFRTVAPTEPSVAMAAFSATGAAGTAATLPPPYGAGLQIRLGGLCLYVGVAPANDPAPPSRAHRHERTRRRRRVRNRNLFARMLCEHDFYYSWRRSRIVCVRCGTLRPIP